MNTLCCWKHVKSKYSMMLLPARSSYRQLMRTAIEFKTTAPTPTKSNKISFGVKRSVFSVHNTISWSLGLQIGLTTGTTTSSSRFALLNWRQYIIFKLRLTYHQGSDTIKCTFTSELTSQRMFSAVEAWAPPPKPSQFARFFSLLLFLKEIVSTRDFAFLAIISTVG